MLGPNDRKRVHELDAAARIAHRARWRSRHCGGRRRGFVGEVPEKSRRADLAAKATARERPTEGAASSGGKSFRNAGGAEAFDGAVSSGKSARKLDDEGGVPFAPVAAAIAWEAGAL